MQPSSERFFQMDDLGGPAGQIEPIERLVSAGPPRNAMATLAATLYKMFEADTEPGPRGGRPALPRRADRSLGDQ